MFDQVRGFHDLEPTQDQLQYHVDWPNDWFQDFFSYGDQEAQGAFEEACDLLAMLAIFSLPCIRGKKTIICKYECLPWLLDDVLTGPCCVKSAV
jgi:hypothetical protein